MTDTTNAANSSPITAESAANTMTDCRSQLEALIDIYDDGVNNPPESRTYVDGAFLQQIEEARALLAQSTPSAPQQAGDGLTNDALIDAAEARAALYDDDPRQDIKTDVMNAFYAGAAFAAPRQPGEMGAVPDASFRVGGVDFACPQDAAHLYRAAGFEVTAASAQQDDREMLDDWRRAAQAATSHLDYPTDAPEAVNTALRQLRAALCGNAAVAQQDERDGAQP